MPDEKKPSRKKHVLRNMRPVGAEKDLATVIGHAFLRVDFQAQMKATNALIGSIRQPSVVAEIMDALKGAELAYEDGANA